MKLQILRTSVLTFSKLTIAIALFATHASASVAAHSPEKLGGGGSLSEKQRKIRLKHAHELLGRYYKKSSANVGESIPKINSAVYHWTREHLPKKFKDQSGKIAQTIIDVSTQHQFDPVFLMSVIEGESSWRPDKVGGVGEVGLMQLRPSTAKWMAKRAGVKWQGDATLYDPCKNIAIGAAYLSYLRDRFDDHARLYLAAYNMGQTNVDVALDKKIWPKDYPIHVMKRYVAFYEAFGMNAGRSIAAGALKLSKATAKILKKTLIASKTPGEFQIVMKPSKQKKVYPTPSFDEGLFIDVDRLTRSDADVNDLKVDATASDDDLKNDLGGDDEPVKAGSASTTRALPGRS